MTDITEIIGIVVKILAVIVSAILIPYIKSKLGEAKLTNISKWLEFAVNAAEEADRKGLIDKAAKYNYAVALLNKNGITFDAETTQALIDSTCYELFNQFKADSVK